MRTCITILTIMFLFNLSACGSSAKKKAASKELQTKSDARIQLTNEYKECVVKAGGDKAKAKECESYLDAIKNLK